MNVSEITDPHLLGEIETACYLNQENRPAWIGAGFPKGPSSHHSFIAWAVAHRVFYLSLCEDFISKKGSILDIGCGAGSNTLMLAQDWAEHVIGMDTDADVIKFARKYNDAANVRWMPGKFPLEAPTGQFDYIFCVETIEHIKHEEQTQFIAEAIQHLKGDGLLFITTPDEETCGVPHIGTWTDAHEAFLLKELAPHIVSHDYLDSKTAISPPEYQPRSSKEKATHHRMVLRRADG